ncbi:c-type cytochrome biogenesis protein CcmI [Aliiruegeria sabulilitoris]|uniref:c-type cytochrome biogenesis protein CcmI n=1 Tax=Aliiruegeria sabulilitoris TaxID=1510458 RepID=UPI0008350B58|nr:c-type cytochrome biogenesis protein CcmI [Aliiruegeria sabulilitoris]NDR56780.1 c-type cytochrome biogenesis protein CcmI [Pseudoruegeria sp. M32A2M]
MIFWAVATLLVILCGLWIARPFLRHGAMEMEAADSTISIYRDQLDEVERDREAGLISPAECDAARQEIERRALAAARRMDQGFFMGHRSVPAALSISAMVVVAALGTYLALGTPQAPDQPLAARRSEMLTQQAAAGDISSSIQLLIDATEKTPEDLDTWWLLGKSYAAVGDLGAAAEAYRRAAELSENDPEVLATYAEAMIKANGNKVPPAARIIFEQVLAETPEPRARYYIALAKAQAQDFQGAIEDWGMLLADSPEGAGWIPMVRRDMANMARFLKQDLRTYLPDATPAEIAASGGTIAESGTARIAELEASLGTEPADYKGWIELATLRSGAGNGEGALAALNEGRSHFRAAPFVLQKFDETARALGLDMLDRGPGVSGPDAEQVAAISQLSREEQDEMIDGMVAGLAAKLEENPDNLDGWIMLVRSYANLGQMETAREAYESAKAQFSGRQAALDALRSGAGAVLGAN